MNIFVLFLLGYILYRFIGGFLIPLFRTTHQMKQQFHNVKQRASENSTANNNSNTGFSQKEQSGNAKSVSSKIGEYIDFEEVK